MPHSPQVVAAYAPHHVKFDATLSDPVWQKAAAYEMSVPGRNTEEARRPLEGGKVRFAWNEIFFYMAVDFVDSDVVAEGTRDGLHHYQMGDLAELFLHPFAHRWYWEMYVTPREKHTTFFFEGGGRLALPSCFKHQFDLHVQAHVDGTLNDPTTRDRGWTAQMAVPVSELTKRGEAWGPGADWRVLVGRYNYSVHLPKVEHSAMPAITAVNFHARAEYAKLIFEAPTIA